jgi:beta-glucosidase
MSAEHIEARVDAIMAGLTLRQAVSLLSGADFWSIQPDPALGLGALRVTDGPNGARGGGSLIGGVQTAAFPVGIALGATWNPALAREIGAALAAQVKSKNAHVLLAPTVNIQRSVTNGRNFECYSEDPVLTAELAVAYIQGLQAEGISGTIKHFAGNESEIERTTISSNIDERSLREVYLIPFEAAVKRGKTWGIMSSYNKVNGTYAAENHWLLTEVLREDWGYDGIVMSDWFGSRTTAPTVNAGLDLEMPGPTRDRGDKLLAAVAAGEVSEETVMTRARAMLRLMARVGSLDDHRAFSESAHSTPELSALIRRAGAEGIVMLKNDGGLLPLPKTGTLAVIGPNAKAAQIMGGGSAQLNPHYAISPFDGLVAALGAENLTYAAGCTNHRWEPVLQGPLSVEFFAGRDLKGPALGADTMETAEAFWIPPLAGGAVDPAHFSARIRGTFTPSQGGIHRVGAVAAGFARVYVNGHLVANAWDGWKKGRTFFEEGCDEVVGVVDLPAGKPAEVVIEFANRPADNLVFSALRIGIGRPMGDADIAEAARVAAAADRAVVFVGRNAQWDTEGSDLENIRLPGRQDELVAAVLAANPKTVVVLQTGGPVEMPWLGAAPALVQAWYAGQETGHAIADVLLGAAEPKGRLAQTFPRRWNDNPTHSQDAEIYPGLNGQVRYEEGVFIGYRHYDRHGVAPLFPFGFGLTHTTFALSNLRIGADLQAYVTVANTGAQTGTAVVQLYVAPQNAPVQRPEKELKAFAKVELAAGAAREIALHLTARDFAYWDVGARGWHVAAGNYTLLAGLSAMDIQSSASIVMGEFRIAP